MSDDTCKCAKCFPNGWVDLHEPTELESLPKGERVWAIVDASLVDRQRACIEHLLGLIGYLPEGLAVLEQYGLTSEDGPKH